MSVFLLKRLATFLATLLVASLLVFAVLDVLPGNVAQVILGDTATPESIAALEKKLGTAMPSWLNAITPTSPALFWRAAA